jgi:hypothetical protein
MQTVARMEPVVSTAVERGTFPAQLQAGNRKFLDVDATGGDRRLGTHRDASRRTGAYGNRLEMSKIIIATSSEEQHGNLNLDVREQPQSPRAPEPAAR